MTPHRNSNWLLRWVRTLIPPQYHRNPYLYGKIQVYILSMMGINIVGVLFVLINHFLLYNPNQTNRDIIVAIGGALINIIALLILRYSKKLGLSYTIISINGLIVLDLITFDSGGLYSTTLLWTIFIPIGASLLMSIRSGIFWGMVVIINAFGFFIIEEYFIPDIIQTVEPPLARVMDFSFVSAGVLAVIFLFEKGRYHLYHRLIKGHSEMRKQNDELRQLNKEKEQLMSVVAHDLKSPLNTVSTIMNILELSDNLNEEQIDCINSTRDIISSANQLIRDLLYSHEIKELNLTKSKSYISIASLVEKVIASFQTVADAKKIKMDVRYVNADHELNTYPDFIHRILENLISNAIKFSNVGSVIHITSGLVDDKAFFIIRDEGPGISVEDQKKLFMRFQKLSARPTAGESSNGLGLYIVKSLVEILKGEISVNSAVGKGTEFSIKLPAGIEQQQGVA